MRFKLELPVSIPGREQTAKGITALQRQLDQFGNTKISTQEFEAFQDAIAVTADEATELAKALSFENVDSASVEQTARALADLRANTDSTAEDLVALQQASELTSEEFAKLNQSLAALEKRNVDDLARLASSLGSNFSGARQFADSLGLTAAEATNAAARMRELQQAGATQEETFEVLNRELGITTDQFGQLSTEVNKAARAAVEAEAVADAARAQAQAIADAAKEVDSLARLASALGSNLGGAQEFAKSLGLTAVEADRAAARMRELQQAGATQDEIFEVLSREINLTADQYERLSTQANRADKAIDGVSAGSSIKDALGSVVGLANGFNEVGQAIQGLREIGEPIYDFLIGSNEELNQQLLASQANIAATTNISVGGQEVTDPTEKILATQGALRDALDDLETKTKDLVGVTDSDVQGVFQVLLQNTAALTGQSQEFGDAISASTELSAGLVATLSTLGVPIDQARAEVGDLIKGQITSDSIVAKSLGITSAMVQDWKSQGVLVDELNEKFGTFVAGNQLAANSIGGVSSNIQSLIQSLGREVGEDLLSPVVGSLNEMLEFIEANKDAVIAFSKDAILGLVGVIEDVRDKALVLFEAFGPTIQDTLSQIGENVGNASKILFGIVDAFVAIAPVVAPVVGAISRLAGVILGLPLRIIANFVDLFRAAAEGVSSFVNDFVKGNQAIQGALAPTQAMLDVLIDSWKFILNLPANLLDGALNISDGVVGKIRGLGPELRKATDEVLRGGVEVEEGLEEALKNRADAQAEGIELTKEQAAEESALRESVEEQLGSLQAQRKELLAAKLNGKANAETVNEEVKALDAQSAALNESLGDLDKYKGELQLSAKAAQDLGSATDQLAASTEAAQATLAAGTGGTEELEAASRTLQDNTKQQLELGQISTDAALENLRTIATNTQLSADQQLAAEEEITAIKEQELQNRLVDYQLAQDELQADIEAGRVDEIDGEEELTQSRINALDEELKLRKERIAELNKLGRGDSQEATETLQQVQELEQEKEAIALESAKRISELRLEELEKEQAKARQLIELSQVEQENTLKKLRLQGQAGSAEEAQSQLKIEKDRLDEEIKLVKQRNAIELEEKRKLFDQSLEFASNDEERDELRRNFNEETADIERQAAIDQAELEGDLLQNRLDAEEEVREEILRTAEAQSTIANLALDTQLNKNQEIEDSLARQGELIAQQNALFEAQNALQQSQTNLRLNGLERALTATKALEDEEDPVKRKQLEEELTALGVKRGSSELDIIKSKQKAEDELAQQQLEALENQIQSKQLETELEIESNRLAAERLILETQSAAIAAQQQLIEAQIALQADPTNELLQAQLKVAESQLENAGQQATNAEESLSRLDESAAKQRELLRLEDQRLLNEARQAEQFRELDQAQEFAGLGVQNATRLAQAGGPDYSRFAIADAEPLGVESSLAGLPELSLSLPSLPELQVSKGSPLNQNLEGLRDDFKQLAATLINQPPPQVNVTAQTSRSSGPSGGEFGRAAIGAVGLG